jgi:LysM repeat protein
MAIDYNVFYTPKRGAAYRDEQVKSYSHYKEAVDHSPGRLAGRSRIWGDAPLEVQKAVINKLIAAGKAAGMDVRRVAMLLAMVKIESGFNPDAAAGTTSASGLGQFINDTGRAYGLNNSNRFDVNANVKAVVAYFLANEKLAKKNHKPDVWVYKYHHDGPTRDYGGEALATGKFAKIAAAFEKALDVGHALSIVDAAGAPIADATIKIEQNGKAAVMKTNEHGLLPTFMASPGFGPLTIHILKASDEFKQLGQLAIDKLSSAWTIVAPKERIAVKTHVHEDKAPAPVKTPGMHKVAKGETLSNIARAHGTTYQVLAKLNGIEKPYLLFPNQMLKVPEGQGKPAAAKPTPTSTAQAPAQQAQPAAGKPAGGSTKAAADHPPAATKPPTQAATAAATKPVVKENRSAATTHPEATVSKPAASDRVAAAIAYAVQHKEGESIGRCLRYVKRALVAAGYFSKYPGVEHAKDFGPTLEHAGFKNLLVTAPGTNIATAPHGSVIIYAPVEKQTYSGGVISGHIEIKHAGGYVSDFNGRKPCYRTDAVTLKSPLSKKYGITFKATGIWYKE